MNVAEMSTEALGTRLGEVMKEIADIKTQIGFAKGEAKQQGQYRDYRWFNNANHALRMKGREHQMLLAELGRRRKAERRSFNNTVERKFVEAAKRRLDPEVFASLMDEANEMQHNGSLRRAPTED